MAGERVGNIQRSDVVGNGSVVTGNKYSQIKWLRKEIRVVVGWQNTGKKENVFVFFNPPPPLDMVWLVAMGNEDSAEWEQNPILSWSI